MHPSLQMRAGKRGKDDDDDDLFAFKGGKKGTTKPVATISLPLTGARHSMYCKFALLTACC